MTSINRAMASASAVAPLISSKFLSDKTNVCDLICVSRKILMFLTTGAKVKPTIAIERGKIPIATVKISDKNDR